MTSNDIAWDKIFEELNISKELTRIPYFQITASQINTIGKREARLMAKFDTKESLPQIFKDSELNINAISNGSYIIFKDEKHQSFISLPDYKEIIPRKVTPVLDFELQTLLFAPRMSESNALDFAHHSRILNNYCGEKELKLTTRGRFFSDGFNFQLGKLGEIGVKGVQIEVDAGYEGREQFLIIEAKSSTRSNFNIRQLYYPYRHFEKKTTKKIRAILLSFSNGIYYFTEIELHPNYYDYRIINNEAIEVVIEEKSEEASIIAFLSQPTHTPHSIPVPQADNLDKVIDLAAFLLDGPRDKFEIAEYFEFDERQGDYYGNAAMYIGLVEKSAGLFKLTELGNEIVHFQNRENRNFQVVKAILKTRVFNDLVSLYLKQQNQMDDQQIIKRLSEEGLTGSTPQRRKSTVRSWLNWILSNLPKK